MDRERLQRWDTRYQAIPTDTYEEPVALLREHDHLLPPHGRALDIACGGGRNALFLAQSGLRVVGIDISPAAATLCYERSRRLGVKVEVIVADLEQYALPSSYFDVILSFYYLQRDLISQIVAALKPYGLLFFETYTVEQQQFDRGPRDAQHLLHSGELRTMFSNLEVLVYREGIFDDGRGPKAIASLIGRKSPDAT